ncbi:hypothetical protein TIFTF001_003385 [Ficus carica]|uniref:BTB domain-containing protein n=1 Tax=Ficus carica TaxID=3494 RepID=A0AA88DAC5_FICCA|nr:hypothetical protein TIFTF001_003385 [Ficus carica]
MVEAWVRIKMRKLWRQLKDCLQMPELMRIDLGRSITEHGLFDGSVETIRISAAILAARSPFFYKLFSIGMLESDQRHVTLRIHSSEEAALMDLLNFMYSNTLTDLPMTRESALRYLGLPSTVLNAAAVQPLIEAAKQFLAGLYKDITKFHDDILNLPLVGIEAVLSSDDLQVDSEYAVFDFVLKWARAHYPKLEERREVFGSRLHCLIRFPFMTCKKLAMFLFCKEFDRELVRKLVLGALFLKAQAPAYRWRPLAPESADFVCRRIVERAYKLRPVKVVEFQLPRQQSIVYLDLKREECTHLFPVDSVRSQAFYLGGQVFYLSAECRKDQQSSLRFFGLFLGMHGTTSESLSVEMEFSARSKPTEDYMRKYRGIATFTGGDVFGCQNLSNIPWTTFMADKSPNFINGILHLRAVLTVKQ